MGGFAVGALVLGSLVAAREAFVGPLGGRQLLLENQYHVSCPSRQRLSGAKHVSYVRRARSTQCRMEVQDLEKVADNIAGKRLEAIDEAQGVYNYEFEIEAPSSMTQRLNSRITRAVKDKAQYPNMRKGDLPPDVILQIKKFVVEETMNESISMALDTYGLVGADGDKTDAQILSDIVGMSMRFKAGQKLPFTCRIHAKPKPEETEDEAEADAEEETRRDEEGTPAPTSSEDVVEPAEA